MGEFEESPYKIYVDVIEECTKEGKLIPKVILWSDGTQYKVQKITEIRRAASLRAGSMGLRYTVYVEGYESYLFYGDDRRWFVEANET